MIDYRFTGHTNDGTYVDIRFRTDAINPHDTNLNILQVQDGENFSTGESVKYLKYFSSTFQRKNTTWDAMYNFAVDNGLNLRSIDEKGNVVKEVMADSASTSIGS
jgi:hypothetical protein